MFSMADQSASQDNGSKMKSNNSPTASSSAKRPIDLSDDKTNPVNSLSPAKQIRLDEAQDASLMKRNVSGIKSSLHGISYQLKLCIVVCLAKANLLMDKANTFHFEVRAEDPDAGKFDDFVYEFQQGRMKGILQIQAKHKLPKEGTRSTVPKITLTDLITERDTNNPFAIQKYFISFYDQESRAHDKYNMEGFIICTNSDFDEKVDEIWKVVDDQAVMNDKSLDSYVSSLFASTGGKCYQLKYDNLKGGSYDLEQSIRKCSKSSRLANILIKAIKSAKNKITQQNLLCKDYQIAIISIIDSGVATINESYKFTVDFLDSTAINPTPGYEVFREEFAKQYEQEFRKKTCKSFDVWNDLKNKHIYVAKAFLTNVSVDTSNTTSFPYDKVDDATIQTFCEQFRFVCATKSHDVLDDAIIDQWRNLYSYSGLSVVGKHSGYVEGNLVTKILFKTNFDWLVNPFAKPLYSEDIEKDLENISNTLAHIKLKGSSERLFKKVLGSPFRISHTGLKSFELYEQIKAENLLEIEAFDISFATVLLSDILSLHGRDLNNTLLLEDTEFSENQKAIEDLFRSAEHRICLVIICNTAFKAIHTIVRKWRKSILNESTKQVFLIKKVSETLSDLSCFHICDVSEGSWKQFLDESIPLCSTTISAAKLFQRNFETVSIEEVIKQLDYGLQMETNNQIVKKYRQIVDTYVQRFWIDQRIELEAENLDSSDGNKMVEILSDIHKLKDEHISFFKVTELIKNHRHFDTIFAEANKRESKLEIILGDKTKKMLILLGEPGSGKSTSLTWLAWHLREENPESWIIRWNLSDHCTDFKRFIEGSGKQDGTINENDALRMLYELIHLSLVEMSSVDLQSTRLNVRKCSECIVLFDGQAILNDERMEENGLSLKNIIQLRVFQEKFNAGELVLLMDGFDEIAPHYKEVMLQFLSLFAQFDGVSKLFLTSRPYSFKQQFEKVFEKSVFLHMEPLSLHDKGSILNKIMKIKMHDERMSDKAVLDFYNSLCFILLYRLGELSDLPLNLMMATDIFVRLADRFINISCKEVSGLLFEVIADMAKPSFIVEQFVDIKMHLIYNKLGANPNVADNPILIDEHVKKSEKVQRQHGLMALWVLFDISEIKMILTDTELSEAYAYMKEIDEAKEKTGIIHGIQDEGPLFIHRTFAEYFAAWWVVKRQPIGKEQGKIKIHNLATFWKQEGLRKHVDRILARQHPLHLAIIENDLSAIRSLLSANPKAFNQRDDGNRTPLHLLACYRKYDLFTSFQLPPIESEIINEKDKMLGWTILDTVFYANFHLYRRDPSNSQFVFYLLYHGASINVDVLYDQVVLPSKVNVGQAASYARYVLEYLSYLGIPYESHDATKIMKQFCDKVATCLINEISADFGRLRVPNIDDNYELSAKEKSTFNEIIQQDSPWLLESVVHNMADQGRVNLIISNSFLDAALKDESVCILKYFLENNSSLLTEQIFRECVAMSVVGDYKNEFKFFFNLYSYRIQDLQPCSTNKTYPDFRAVFDVSKEKIWNIFQINDRIFDNLQIENYNIPLETVANKNILSVIIICVTLKRPLMLKYLNESCNMQFSAGLVYYLAHLIDYCIREMHPINYKFYDHIAKQNSIKSIMKDAESNFKCLLGLATNKGDVEVIELIRHAITSDLFKFSKCLIELYDNNFQAVDDSQGWNVFHVCVSRPRSDYDYTEESMLELFHNLLDRTDIDCFGAAIKDDCTILRLAIKNGHSKILDYIVLRKLGLNRLNEIGSLDVDSIPNLTLCCRAIHEASKSIGDKGCYHKLLCALVQQIANISLTTHDESNQQRNRGLLLLEENAQELYQVAMKCNSLSLMHYLHREFGCSFPRSIDDADWLSWVVIGLNSPNFRLFQWIVCQYCVANQIMHPTKDDNIDHIACEVLEEFDANKYDYENINLKDLFKEAEVQLSDYQSKEEVYIMKLVLFTICLGHEPAVRYLCETFSINIDQKVLFDIIEIVHHGLRPCEFMNSYFQPVYKYLFERTSNFHETDAEGRNILHLAAESGRMCMVSWLFKLNMISPTIINKQNGWNFFHYSASRMPDVKKCSLTPYLFRDILEGMLKNDELSIEGTIKSREQKIKEICFDSNEGGTSVFHLAVASGDMYKVHYMIRYRLGINSVYDHKSLNLHLFSKFRECYDALDQIAAHLPFNANTELLLSSMARLMDSFSLKTIVHTIEPENDNVIEDICRDAIKYRSISTLEHLILACKHQMNHALASSSSRDLFTCMIECIRRNRISLFKVLIGHYRTLIGIKPSVDVEYEKIENDTETVATREYKNIQWSFVDQIPQHESTNRGYLPLLFLSVGLGSLPMTQSLIEMLQVVVSKPMILLLINATNKTNNCEHKVSVYEYLSNRCEAKIYLLHLSAQSKDRAMVRYLLKHKLLDPCEIDSENGWNAGHYCVSKPACEYIHVLKNDIYDVLKIIMDATNMDCFSMYDRKGRNVLHLAIERGHVEVIEHIIKHRLLIARHHGLRTAWNLAKINECIIEIQRMKLFFPNNTNLLDILQQLIDRKNMLTSVLQALHNFPMHSK